MLVSFLIAGAAGVAVGCFFRASALVAASFVLLIYSATVVYERGAISAIAISFALLATMQAGYICGVALSGLRKKIMGFLKHQYESPIALPACLRGRIRHSTFHSANFK